MQPAPSAAFACLDEGNSPTAIPSMAFHEKIGSTGLFEGRAVCPSSGGALVEGTGS